MSLTRTVAFPDDDCTVRLNSDAHFSGIDCNEAAAVFPGQDTLGVDRLTAPAVKTEDTIGFCDRVPTFNVGQLAAMDFTRADMARVEVALERLHLFC